MSLSCLQNIRPGDIFHMNDQGEKFEILVTGYHYQTSGSWFVRGKNFATGKEATYVLCFWESYLVGKRQLITNNFITKIVKAPK